MGEEKAASAKPDFGRITAEVGGRRWTLLRPGDLESLWAKMGEAAPAAIEPGAGVRGGPDSADDERPPYWVELWPAEVLLARFIAAHAAEVRGRTCLDAGCGLGLAALVASAAGARVVAFDYAPEALFFARRSAVENGAPQPLWIVMDWRRPAVAPGRAELLFGADILYERRFFAPVAAFLDFALAPGGRAWIADPERSVSADVWERLVALGWRVTTLCSGRISQGGQNMMVHIREISRNS